MIAPQQPVSAPTLTAAELNEWQRLADVASPSPWPWQDTDPECSDNDGLLMIPLTGDITVSRLYFGDMESCTPTDFRNAEFVSAAREAVPRLRAALRAAEARAERAERLLQRAHDYHTLPSKHYDQRYPETPDRARSGSPWCPICHPEYAEQEASDADA